VLKLVPAISSCSCVLTPFNTGFLFDGPATATRLVRQIRAVGTRGLRVRLGGQVAAGLATDTAASRPAFLEVRIHAEETVEATDLFPTVTNELSAQSEGDFWPSARLRTAKCLEI
jgi:hypothetical protein